MFSGGRSAALMGVMLTVVVGVTVTLALLLVESAERTDVFVLSLGAIIFAELLFGGVPIYQTLKPSTNRSAFPHQAANQYVLGLYLAATLVAAGIGMAGVSFTVLLVIHLVLAVGVMLMSGVLGLASSRAGASDVQLAQERAPMEAMRARFKRASDRLALLDDEGLAEVKGRVGETEEALRFASSESVAGIAATDGDLATEIGKVEASVDALESLLGQSAEAEAVAEQASGLTKGLARVEQIIERRDEELMRLRSAS